jgi:hypothetical protein
MGGMNYIECSLPEHMTLAEYRRARSRTGRRRGLGMLLRRA